MSFKKPFIGLALLYCALAFIPLDISALVSKPENPVDDSSCGISRNTTSENNITCNYRSIPLQPEEETSPTVAPIEQKQTLSLSQTSSTKDEILTGAPVDEKVTANQHPPLSGTASPSPYTIKKGDTPRSIAAQHSIPMAELLLANQNIDSKKLQIGQILNLPNKSVTTTIKIEARLGKKMILGAKNIVIASSPDSKDRIGSAKIATEDAHPKIPISQKNAGKEEISSNFGKRSDPVNNRQKFHKGIDIPRPTGTEVFAWSDGVVSRSGWLRGYGLTVDVTHPNGIKTRYAHLKLTNVQEGQKLYVWQTLGQVGRTGRTTGANLHFEVIVAGKLTNPRNYLTDDFEIVENRTSMKNSKG
jgi:murein DD-endopeptidase MepM/ murein hydrolase activator NlpD